MTTLLLALGILLGVGYSQLPGAGAGALLHPMRVKTAEPAPASCADETFAGAGVALRGWRCATTRARRGTVVFLHGVGASRGGTTWIVERYLPRGFDVVVYDSRAHGESEGDVCTYGFYEKQDLTRVLDTLSPGPVVLVGASLGAAVALQTAAMSPRVSGVVAAETFSDLRTVAGERAPFVIRLGSFGRAIRLAEERGRFTVDDVSPVRAARAIIVPVFLAHGALDRDTPPAHSQRVFAALAGPKHLELVPGVGHNQSLQPHVWDAIDRWLGDVVPQ